MNKRIQKSNSLHTHSLSLSRVRPNKYGVIFLFGSQKDSHRRSSGYINKRTPSSIRFPLRTNHKTDSTYCRVLLGFLLFLSRWWNSDWNSTRSGPRPQFNSDFATDSTERRYGNTRLCIDGDKNSKL